MTSESAGSGYNGYLGCEDTYFGDESLMSPLATSDSGMPFVVEYFISPSNKGEWDACHV